MHISISGMWYKKRDFSWNMVLISCCSCARFTSHRRILKKLRSHPNSIIFSALIVVLIEGRLHSSHNQLIEHDLASAKPIILTFVQDLPAQKWGSGLVILTRSTFGEIWTFHKPVKPLVYDVSEVPEEQSTQWDTAEVRCGWQEANEVIVMKTFVWRLLILWYLHNSSPVVTVLCCFTGL
jgi:hypothetical protein